MYRSDVPFYQPMMYRSSEMYRSTKYLRCAPPGRDFDLPRHSHYSGVIPMVFEPNIVTPTTAAGARAATERTPLGPRGNHI